MGIKMLLFISILAMVAVPTFGQNIERMFQTDVKIYLYKTGIAPNSPSDTFVRPVERMVPNDFKVDYTFRALFDEEIPEEEMDEGFSSPTYGMQFEDVVIKRGIATVKFSQPAGKNYDMFIPTIFVDAIKKTARQFRSVKRVNICAVGKTTVKTDLGRPFPRCN